MNKCSTNQFPDFKESAEQCRREIYQQMSVAEKLAVVEDLYFTALALKKAHFRRHYPEWANEKVEKKAKQWMMYART